MMMSRADVKWNFLERVLLRLLPTHTYRPCVEDIGDPAYALKLSLKCGLSIGRGTGQESGAERRREWRERKDQGVRSRFLRSLRLISVNSSKGIYLLLLSSLKKDTKGCACAPSLSLAGSLISFPLVKPIGCLCHALWVLEYSLNVTLEKYLINF